MTAKFFVDTNHQGCSTTVFLTEFPHLFTKRNLGLNFVLMFRPFRELTPVAYPALWITTIISIRLAKTTDLLVAIAVHHISRYADAVAVLVAFDVDAAMFLPFTISDFSILVPTLHRNPHNGQRVKA